MLLSVKKVIAEWGWSDAYMMTNNEILCITININYFILFVCLHAIFLEIVNYEN